MNGKEQWIEVNIDALGQRLTELEYSRITQDIDTETTSMVEYSGQVYIEKGIDGKFVYLWEVLLDNYTELLQAFSKNT